MIYDHKYLHVITNLVDNVCILFGLSFQFNIPTWQFDKILSVRYSHLQFLLRAVLFVENIYRYAYVWVCVWATTKKMVLTLLLVIILSKFECFPVGFGIAYTHHSAHNISEMTLYAYLWIYTQYFDIKSHNWHNACIRGCYTGILTNAWKNIYARNVQNMKMAKNDSNGSSRHFVFHGRIEGNKYIVCVWPPYIQKSRDFLS